MFSQRTGSTTYIFIRSAVGSHLMRQRRLNIKPSLTRQSGNDPELHIAPYPGPNWMNTPTFRGCWLYGVPDSNRRLVGRVSLSHIVVLMRLEPSPSPL